MQDIGVELRSLCQFKIAILHLCHGVLDIGVELPFSAPKKRQTGLGLGARARGLGLGARAAVWLVSRSKW